MAKVRIDLQEDFLNDKVIIHKDNETIFSNDNVSTRRQIGFAERIQFESATPTFTLKIELPQRNIAAQREITADRDVFIGVTLKDNQLAMNIQSSEFWYA